jgi:hypothetical protein
VAVVPMTLPSATFRSLLASASRLGPYRYIALRPKRVLDYAAESAILGEHAGSRPAMILDHPLTVVRVIDSSQVLLTAS